MTIIEVKHFRLTKSQVANPVFSVRVPTVVPLIYFYLFFIVDKLIFCQNLFSCNHFIYILLNYTFLFNVNPNSSSCSTSLDTNNLGRHHKNYTCKPISHFKEIPGFHSIQNFITCLHFFCKMKAFYIYFARGQLELYLVSARLSFIFQISRFPNHEKLKYVGHFY